MKKVTDYAILFGMGLFKGILLVYSFVLGGTASYAAGLLKAESFPGTFSDLSFQNRMAVLAQGYEGFETKFDSSGKCISGCPYRGITLAQMQRLSNENTAAGNAYINNLGQMADVVSPPQQETVDVAQDIETSPVAPAPVPSYPTPTPPVVPPAPQWKCSNHSNIVKITNTVPVQAPLDCDLVITSDYGSRNAPTAGASTWHGGIDLSAPTGTPVYAPAGGRVVAMPGGDCGLGLELDHGNGFVTKYCHLSARAVSVGDVVQAGCHIGNVGNTGVSTGPHLHYAIMYNGKPFDPLYPENRLGRSYSMSQMSSGRPGGTILPGRI
ncbi:MAG: M23 family metallopeptidase [Alphaproteobacteria bacterium]|nr:M23 family metallopeptidase [Alphaproteobacteria bacterium]